LCLFMALIMSVYALPMMAMAVERVPGDIDGDGVLTNTDIVTIARYIVGLTDRKTSSAVVTYADSNGDHKVDNVDLVCFARIIVGLVESGGKEKSILLNKLGELKNAYGVFKSPQSGTMRSETDKWLNPNGIVSTTIWDFDNDGSQEMLVVISKKVSGEYCLTLDMYEVKNNSAVLSDNMPFKEYFENNNTYRNGITIRENEWHNISITVDTVIRDKKSYILCKEKSKAVAFADGLGCGYWIVKYSDNKLQYVCSFGDWIAGSGEHEFIGYDFQNGKLIGSAVYYAYGYMKNNPLYDSFDKAINAFFGKYGFALKSYGSIYDYGDYKYNIDDLESELVFDFENENTSRWPYTYIATVTRGNNQLS